MTAFTLNYITLHTHHLQRSLNFYHRLLGIQVLQQNPHQGYALLDGGQCQIALISTSPLTAPPSHHTRTLWSRWLSLWRSQSSTPASHAPAKASLEIALSFHCDDVTAEYNRLLHQGVVFIDHPTKQPWGGIRVQLRDPDGHLLYFVST